MKVGFGFDVHQIGAGHPFIVGGVRLDHPSGAFGHSDADVLLHAITDALLGAAALGDIGSHFPDTDARFKGADSAFLLGQAWRSVQSNAWHIGNIDSTVIAQAPRLSPHICAMRASVARILHLDVERVNIKAKTAERLGAVGQGLAMEARAVVLLHK